MISSSLRPNPAAVRSAALAQPWRLSLGYALLLGALACVAPGWAGGDVRAALLPGVPSAIVLGLFWLGRNIERRRVTMALTTTTAGFLALTTMSSLGAVDRLEGPGGLAVAFQLACLALSAAFLATTATAWRRVNEEGAAADALLRMYEEL
ncbi:hypothetical protein [Planctomycetes bacterium Poly30]